MQEATLFDNLNGFEWRDGRRECRGSDNDDNDDYDDEMNITMNQQDGRAKPGHQAAERRLGRGVCFGTGALFCVFWGMGNVISEKGVPCG